MFIVKNGNQRTIKEICSNLIIKISKRCRLFWTSFTIRSSFSIVDLEQLNAGQVVRKNFKFLHNSRIKHHIDMKFLTVMKYDKWDHPESKSLQKRAPTVFDGLTKSPLSRFEGVLAKVFLFKKMFRKLLLVKIKKTDIFCKTYLQEFTLLCSSVLAWNIQLPSQQHAWMLRRTFANSWRFSLTKIPRLEPRARLSRITWRKGKRINISV